jgi:hypothetical protein
MAQAASATRRGGGGRGCWRCLVRVGVHPKVCGRAVKGRSCRQVCKEGMQGGRAGGRARQACKAGLRVAMRARGQGAVPQACQADLRADVPGGQTGRRDSSTCGYQYCVFINPKHAHQVTMLRPDVLMLSRPFRWQITVGRARKAATIRVMPPQKRAYSVRCSPVKLKIGPPSPVNVGMATIL